MKFIKGVKEIYVFTEPTSFGILLVLENRTAQRLYTSFAKVYVEATAYAVHYGLNIEFDDVMLAKIFAGIAKVDSYENLLIQMGEEAKYSPAIYDFTTGSIRFY